MAPSNSPQGLHPNPPAGTAHRATGAEFPQQAKPRAQNSSATVFTRGVEPTIATSAPASIKPSAIPRPRPRVPPVTSAFQPRISNSSVIEAPPTIEIPPTADPALQGGSFGCCAAVLQAPRNKRFSFPATRQSDGNRKGPAPLSQNEPDVQRSPLYCRTSDSSDAVQNAAAACPDNNKPLPNLFHAGAAASLSMYRPHPMSARRSGVRPRPYLPMS